MPSVFISLILDVADMDRSLGFYSGLLCLPVRHVDDCDGHRLAYLTTGMTEILLIQQPKGEQATHSDRSSGLVINFQVKSLTGLIEILEDNDVMILRDLEQDLYGDCSCLVSDPDGYAVLLSEEGRVLKRAAELL